MAARNRGGKRKSRAQVPRRVEMRGESEACRRLLASGAWQGPLRTLRCVRLGLVAFVDQQSGDGADRSWASLGVEDRPVLGRSRREE